MWEIQLFDLAYLNTYQELGPSRCTRSSLKALTSMANSLENLNVTSQVYSYVCIYIYTPTCIYVYAFVHACVHVHACVCVYMCAYVHVRTCGTIGYLIHNDDNIEDYIADLQYHSYHAVSDPCVRMCARVRVRVRVHNIRWNDCMHLYIYIYTYARVHVLLYI